MSDSAKAGVVVAAALVVLAAAPNARRVDPLTGMTFTLIPAGSFEMGSPPAEKEREAQELRHHVTIARSFYLGIYEVTQQQWTKVMQANPANFQGCPACPVERISYFDVHAFIDRLNRASPWEGFRLPTEAEWEYACRADGSHAYGASDTIDRAHANYDGDRTLPVGSFQPNGWGLFDMSGNVWEWTSDNYALSGRGSAGSCRLHARSQSDPRRQLALRRGQRPLRASLYASAAGPRLQSWRPPGA